MDKLLAILTEVNDEIDFANEKAMVDDGLLDSLELLKIIAALDEAYGIHINAGEIEPEHFNCLAAIYALVMDYVGMEK